MSVEDFLEMVCAKKAQLASLDTEVFRAEMEYGDKIAYERAEEAHKRAIRRYLAAIKSTQK